MITQAEIEAYIKEMHRAADSAGKWPERRERLRKRPWSPSSSHLETELRRAYEEATDICLAASRKPQ
jgi:hypothetical protein